MAPQNSWNGREDAYRPQNAAEDTRFLPRPGKPGPQGASNQAYDGQWDTPAPAGGPGGPGGPTGPQGSGGAGGASGGRFAFGPFFIGLAIGLVVALVVGIAAWMMAGSEKRALAAEVDGIQETLTAYDSASTFVEANEYMCEEHKGNPDHLALLDKLAGDTGAEPGMEAVTVEKLHFVGNDRQRIRFEDSKYPTLLKKEDGAWLVCDPYVNMRQLSEAYEDGVDSLVGTLFGEGGLDLFGDLGGLETLEGLNDITGESIEDWEQQYQDLMGQLGL